MDTITAKAQLVATDAGLSPDATGTGLGSIIQIILQLLQGLGMCAPTAAKVHQVITKPGPLHRRALRRTVRKNISNPALQIPVEESVQNVASRLTIQETTQMYKEANGVDLPQ